MPHANWCNKLCYLCENPCLTDITIPCSPDCEHLSENGEPTSEECKNCECYEIWLEETKGSNNMKEWNIQIIDDQVYINGELQHCAMPMDKGNHEDDLNKRVLLALADNMGYEPVFLFEEMTDRLDEMLDEVENDDE